MLYASSAVNVVGDWALTADTSAAGGVRMQNANLRAPKANASATPSSSFDLVFEADAGKPYYLWVRGRALKDDLSNDSVYVQFDGSVTASGTPANRIASTTAQSVLLENCSGCGIKGWGWTDNTYGGAGSPIYFATSGTQRLRVQPREDGLAIDQIVLSKAKYTGNAPGSPKNDIVILPPTN